MVQDKTNNRYRHEPYPACLMAWHALRAALVLAIQVANRDLLQVPWGESVARST